MLFRVFGFSGPDRRRVEARSAREKSGAQWRAGEESQAGLHVTDITRKPQRAQQFEAVMMARQPAKSAKNSASAHSCGSGGVRIFFFARLPVWSCPILRAPPG